MYSELLHVGGDDQTNAAIDQINTHIKSICSSHTCMVFAHHTELQLRDDMYDDEAHINYTTGTRAFIRDTYCLSIILVVCDVENKFLILILILKLWV